MSKMSFRKRNQAVEWIKIILGILGILLSIGLGIYIGVWYMFIGGIVQVIEQIRAEDLVALEVAIGVAKVVFAGFVGWMTVLIGLSITKAFFS